MIVGALRGPARRVAAQLPVFGVACLCGAEAIQGRRGKGFYAGDGGKAFEEFGDDLEIASTANIEKRECTDEVRVIFDGCSGIDLNPGIRVRDQVKYATAADAKRVVSEIADESGPYIFRDSGRGRRTSRRICWTSGSG